MDWHNDARFFYQQDLVKQEVEEENGTKTQPTYEFRVFARDFKTYFIQNLSSLDCCWCYANKSLGLGEIVHGQLLSTNNLAELPTLIIGDS